VHYNNGDFHCGGFYTHNNNDKTTFVVAPEQAANNGFPCAAHQTLNTFPTRIPPQWIPGFIPNPIQQMRVRVQSNNWHQVQYNFCDTDCDNNPLNNNVGNPNCGNQ